MPSPLSSRSAMLFRRVMVLSILFASASSFASLPRVPLPALIPPISSLVWATALLALL